MGQSCFNSIDEKYALVFLAFEVFINEDSLCFVFEDLECSPYCSFDDRLVLQVTVLKLDWHLKVFEQRIANNMQIEGKTLFSLFILLTS